MLALAPMEGLVDEHMRHLLTRDNGFDHCVTEFLRVTNQLLPEKAFHRICPEFSNDWKTPSGTPVHLQLLGNDVAAMTDNACRAAELGAPSVDINFGCPMFVRNAQKSMNFGQDAENKVNKCGESYGGSLLLQFPDEIHNLLSSIRKAMPADTPLTAKMRLGYEDKSLAFENAQAIESAGVSHLCIHARTKTEGYKPPAHWHYIARIKEHVSLPIIANGEIWTLSDYKTCKQESNCDNIMLGRGAVANPKLARQIKQFESGQNHPESQWPERLHDLLWMIEDMSVNGDKTRVQGKIKQWVTFMKFRYEEAHEFFKLAKKLKTPLELKHFVQQCIIEHTA